MIAAAAIILSLVFYPAILSGLGSYLVRSEAPRKSDIAVVLAGDGSGNRVLKGAELARQGFVTKVVVSGPPGYYGHHEDELAIPFAVSAGYPPDCFVPLEHGAHSTRDEALAILPELRRRGAHQILLVTSDFHTRRAGKIFRSQAPDLVFDVVAAPDFYFTPDGWWRNREGRKTFVIEWLKTVTEWVGL